jgi:hypothetical protein
VTNMKTLIGLAWPKIPGLPGTVIELNTREVVVLFLGNGAYRLDAVDAEMVICVLSGDHGHDIPGVWRNDPPDDANESILLQKVPAEIAAVNLFNHE